MTTTEISHFTQTIRHQVGVATLMAVGARDFVYSDTETDRYLQFKVTGQRGYHTAVKITLEPDDVGEGVGVDEVLGVEVVDVEEIDRVVPLNDGQHWRIEATRHDGSAVHVVVDRSGRDPHDYAAPPRPTATTLAHPVIPV